MSNDGGEPDRSVVSGRLSDALEISGAWLSRIDLRALMKRQLFESGVLGGDGVVDVVAIGKASIEMARAIASLLGDRVTRRLIVASELANGDEGASVNANVVIGEHPIPGAKSVAAGERLVDFLGASTNAELTVFLLSGGASSMCALPQAPLGISDLGAIWDAALMTGVDITTLNRARAATSSIAGGAVLHHVRTRYVLTLIMVDNVISGARWVGSGLTFSYHPRGAQMTSLIDQLGLSGGELAQRMMASFDARSALMERPISCQVENRVVVDPGALLDEVALDARRLGYRVVSMGADVHGDVGDVADRFATTIRREVASDGPLCVVGVGEATVQVSGGGKGGRCQELAWLMASRLASIDCDADFLATASDGRDYVEGVAGAWVDRSTMERLATLGVDWSEVAEHHDSFRGLESLGQIVAGRATGWNLCDIYLALA